MGKKNSMRVGEMIKDKRGGGERMIIRRSEVEGRDREKKQNETKKRERSETERNRRER